MIKRENSPFAGIVNGLFLAAILWAAFIVAFSIPRAHAETSAGELNIMIGICKGSLTSSNYDADVYYQLDMKTGRALNMDSEQMASLEDVCIAYALGYAQGVSDVAGE